MQNKQNNTAMNYGTGVRQAVIDDLKAKRDIAYAQKDIAILEQKEARKIAKEAREESDLSQFALEALYEPARVAGDKAYEWQKIVSEYDRIINTLRATN